ncbi:hypothetical protein QN337_03065 [Streptococcus agalactiae]|uniref:hypothetical protein n=1 Tax=Streptococcus agalactiae TaxID=1311 RepID=UPI0005DB906C|nr:hypothetical protein [Streptococcus agalactiae]CNJ92326.1 Uncharacterised protein [Streptococcus agalactiae]
MNRLKGLRESKNLTVMQFIEEIRQIAPTMTATQWIAYERRGIVGYNDNFWQMIADFFTSTLAIFTVFNPSLLSETYTLKLNSYVMKIDD